MSRHAVRSGERPAGSPWSTYVWFMIIAIGLIALIACIFLAKYFNLWIQAKMTQANVSILELVGMSFRKVNPNIIVRSKIMAFQAGLSEKDGVTTRALEAHYLAGGNVPNVVRALIAANRADIPLSYKRAAAIDLAGRNVLEAVQTSVNPKVIHCPDPSQGRQTIDGVAKNGIQLKVKAQVTVRTNLDRLVGGATDETIIARVGEGIVNAIGSADTHKHGAREARLDLQARAREGARRRHGLRDPLDRHRRHRRGRQHRRQPPGRPGRGRHARRPRQGRGAAGLRRGPGAGDDRRTSRRTAPRSSLAEAEVPHGDRRGVPQGQPRASSTTTTCGTSRPTPRCGARSRAPATPAGEPAAVPQ